jgi:hypothetical protein
VAVGVLRADGSACVAVLDVTYGVVHARFVVDAAAAGAPTLRCVALPSGSSRRARLAVVTPTAVQIAELPLEPLTLARVVGALAGDSSLSNPSTVRAPGDVRADCGC